MKRLTVLSLPLHLVFPGYTKLERLAGANTLLLVFVNDEEKNVS
jgi:hypothetical protein